MFFVVVDGHSRWLEVKPMATTTTEKTVEALRERDLCTVRVTKTVGLEQWSPIHDSPPDHKWSCGVRGTSLNVSLGKYCIATHTHAIKSIESREVKQYNLEVLSTIEAIQRGTVSRYYVIALIIWPTKQFRTQ